MIMHFYLKLGISIAAYMAVLFVVTTILGVINQVLPTGFMLCLVMLYPAYHDMKDGEVDARLFFGLIAAWPVFLAQWLVLAAMFAFCFAIYGILYAVRKKLPDDWVLGSADIIALPICIAGMVYLGPVALAAGVITFATLYLKKMVFQKHGKKRLLPILWVGIVFSFLAALVVSFL